MKYPFLFHTMKSELDLLALDKDMKIVSPALKVDRDWRAYEFDSPYLDRFVAENFFGLVPHDSHYLMSVATDCLFHIDGLHINLALHRVLIPLDTNFHYSWDYKGKLVTHYPKPKEAIVFNNRVTHRFHLNSDNEKSNRMVIAFSLVDPKHKEFLKELKGTDNNATEAGDLMVRLKYGLQE